MPSALDDILARLDGAPEKEVAAIREQVLARTKQYPWVPNPGPQTDAYFSEADELFYGGEAGGGKSDLLVGLALTEHHRSLLLRRYNDDARDLGERLLEVVEDRKHWNGQLLKYRASDRLIEFGGCQYEDDKQRYKGTPHSLIAFDEVGDFSKSQYMFIKTWNRDAGGERCRVVGAGNPPTKAEGLWVIQYWGAWLDPTHPKYPTPDGVLRWYVIDQDEQDIEVDGPGEYEIGGEKLKARSRTFIRAKLTDNPDLAETDYDSVLSSLPPELRAAYRDGRFDASLKDNPFQVIPTEWIKAANERWTDYPPKGIPMCAIGADVAQGGDDNNVIAIRYDGWFAPLMVLPGKDTPVGKDIAGVLVTQRRDNAEVIIDCGGGYGGSAYKTLKENGISVHPYKGSEKSFARTHDRTLGFANLRTEVWWKFREALDPAVEGGSTIALPHDQRLLADLTAPTFEEVRGQIQLEPKKSVIKRLGRSTDYADAVVMAWWKGGRISSDYGTWQGLPGGRSKPKVILGHQAARRRR